MTRPLGTAGLHLIELGFGGGAIGGLCAAVGRDDFMKAMQVAWDAGMRYFDTARPSTALAFLGGEWVISCATRRAT